MLRELLLSRLDVAGPGVALASAAGAGAGMVLWLAGSRLSRSLVTLVTVGIGAAAGLRVPAWVGLPMGSWATAVCGALILGVSGYAMHRMWVGIALSVVLAACAGAGVLAHFGTGEAGWPVGLPSASVAEYTALAWGQLPGKVRTMLPAGCGLGGAIGLTMGMLFPREAAVLLYSVLGVLMAVGMGLVAMELGRPQMLGMVPTQQSTQMAVVLAMVAFGVAVQWRTAREVEADRGGSGKSERTGEREVE